VRPYLRLSNYTANLQRLGFTEQDVAGEGSDRLIDALVVSGDDALIRQRFEAHHAAGADHVAVQVIAEPGGDLDAALRRLAEILALPALYGHHAAWWRRGASGVAGWPAVGTWPFSGRRGRFTLAWQRRRHD
jgi:hypothetical protein